MEDITDVDYRHAKRVWKDFNRKNLGKYHGLYVLSDIITCRGICEVYKYLS